MAKSELATRFDNAWEKLTCKNDGIPTLDEGGSLTGRSIACEGGKVGVVWVITQELCSTPETPRFHVRSIDMILPDGQRRFACDLGLSISFNTDGIKKALDTVEKIYPSSLHS